MPVPIFVSKWLSIFVLWYRFCLFLWLSSVGLWSCYWQSGIFDFIFEFCPKCHKLYLMFNNSCRYYVNYIYIIWIIITFHKWLSFIHVTAKIIFTDFIAYTCFRIIFISDIGLLENRIISCRNLRKAGKPCTFLNNFYI